MTSSKEIALYKEKARTNVSTVFLVAGSLSSKPIPLMKTNMIKD